MKANLRLVGVTLIAVVVITLISTSSAWPHTNHHRLHDTVRLVTSISSAGSGSSLNSNRSTGNKTSFDISHDASGPAAADTSGVLNQVSSSTSLSYYSASRATPIPLNDTSIEEDFTSTVYHAKTSSVEVVATLFAATSSAALEPLFTARALDPRLVVYSDNPFGGAYQSFVLTFPNQATQSTTSLAPSPMGTSTTSTSTSATSSVPSSTPSSVCPAGNGTTYTSSAGKQYQVICGIDFPDNDYPFQLVDSFDACVQQCDLINTNAGSVGCFAALFVPSREGYANDCYLKSVINDGTSSKLDIEGAILISGVQSSSSSAPSSTTPAVSSLSSSKLSSAVVSSSSASTPSNNPVPTSTFSTVSGIAITYASGSSVVIPTVAASSSQGPTINQPTEEYINWKPPADITLLAKLLTKGVNGDLTTNYDVSLDTGILELNATTQPLLANITDTPHISRDGGKGGYLNGQHLFIFCDTGSYTTTSSTSEGKFLGFVSSSVAIDVGMNGLSGKALTLQDGIGQWTDNQGRMRGFSPMTQGEESYNLAMQGKGQRYAVWPESSIIPLDAETALVYAPIVYDDVNMATKAAVFTYTGNTLLTIAAGGKGGPVSQRTVNKLFDEDEVEWGCVGGIRSWGPSGVGGTDGKMYIFGRVQDGLLLARTGYANVADRDSYEYWTGNAWSSSMQTSTSTAYFISGAFMDVDLFYSPRHLTFIIVYMTVYADSTFYYRYLKADEAILPPSAPGADQSSDYVENLTKYQWSEQKVLYKAPPGLGKTYAYSGGVHQGYYGTDDITNGGTKMLLSWTAPTGQNPASLNSEYQIVTAEVDWD